MKVIRYGDCRVEVGLCNLRCPYCVHLSQKTEDIDVKTLAEYLKNCDHIYIGGAEPTIHRDLMDLLKLLKADVTLKTNGYLVGVVEKVAPYVNKFVFEIKGEDIETVSKLSGISVKRAERYVENLLKSIEIVRSKGKNIRLWFRVIPEFITEEKFRRILERVGKVDEILLYQFLSNPEWDKPFEGASKPSYEFVRRLGEIAKEFASKVIVVGERREVLCYAACSLELSGLWNV